MDQNIAAAAEPKLSAGKMNSRKKLITALVVVPPAMYLCYVGLLFVQDTFFGDGLILALKADWRRHLWNLFWGDWAHALPAMYVICVLLILPIYLANRALGLRSAWVVGLAGALCGAAAGAWLRGGLAPGAVIVPLLTGLISFYAFAVIASPDKFDRR